MVVAQRVAHTLPPSDPLFLKIALIRTLEAVSLMGGLAGYGP